MISDELDDPGVIMRRLETGKFVLVLVAVAATTAGCNSSRYGLMYDKRHHEIHNVHLLPPDLRVLMVHAGGMLEARPDFEDEVRPTLLAMVKASVENKAREFTAPESTLGKDSETRPRSPQSLLLASEIAKAIEIHHYKFGKSRYFDYSLGPEFGVVVPEEADAVLFTQVQAVVPSPSRVALKYTALAMRLVTGIPIDVSTSYTVIRMMLVDAESGDVLWFNQAAKTDNVRSESKLSSLVKSASKPLLEPFE